jgi:hypothetical protein
MKTKRERKVSENRRQDTVERWTIERLDRDAGMVRIETVPMRSEHLTEELVEGLSEQGLAAGMDRLHLWDVSRARTQRMSVGSFAAKLGLRRHEDDTLSENMVFWILRRKGQREPERVFHATRAAREVTKDLYRQVTRREGGTL